MTEITSKPDHGEVIIENGKASYRLQNFIDNLVLQLNQNVLGQQVNLPSYTVSSLPTVNSFPGLIFVSDEIGGAVPAFSDGTDWRRVTDRAIVS